MNIRDNIKSRNGVIIGILFTGTLLSLSLLFPPFRDYSADLILVSGGFCAGLFTRGSLKKGFIAGVICGIAIALVYTAHITLLNTLGGSLNLSASISSISLLLMLFVPLNAIAGIPGVVE